MQMDNYNAQEIKSRIRGIIIKKVLKGKARNFMDDTDLIKDRIYPDSLTIPELSFFLEKAFGVRFSVSEVNAKTFKTVNTIAHLVEEVLNHSKSKSKFVD